MNTPKNSIIPILIIIFILFTHCQIIWAAPDEPTSNPIKATISTSPLNASQTDTNIDSGIQLIGIEITGNRLISSDIIKTQIPIQSTAQVNPQMIDRILNNIQSIGAFESVTSKVENITSNNISLGKKLIIIVKENPVITAVKIEGNTAVSTNLLMQNITLKPNNPLNLNLLRKDIISIENCYTEKGYKWAKVATVKRPITSDGDLTFIIEEGILDSITIEGNTKTHPEVILREMDLKSGMVLEENTLREDLRRIYNLNFFSELNPDIHLASENRYALTIGITEKPSGSINFGGGFGDSSGFFGFIDLYLDNFLGTGQLIALKSQIGQKNNTYEFKYFNPWMFGKHKSFTYRLWKKSGQLNNLLNIGSGSNQVAYTDNQEDRLGTSFTIGIPITYDLRTSHTFKGENVRPASENAYQIISYTFDISYDTRDVWFNPLTGEYLYFSVEKGLDIFFSNATDFTEYDASLHRFFKTFDKQTIATRLDLGYMTGDIKDKSSYAVGGGTTVRGYSDTTPFATGNKRVISSIEYRILFNDMFTGLAFIDAGYATNGGDILYLSKYKIGKGIGMRLNTPIGPFRLDIGINETSDINVHFNIGNVF